MHVVRHLGARPERELAVGIDRGDRRVLLDREVRVALEEERVLEDVIGLRQRLVDVAELERLQPVDVARARRSRGCAASPRRAPPPASRSSRAAGTSRRSGRAPRTRSARPSRSPPRPGRRRSARAGARAGTRPGSPAGSRTAIGNSLPVRTRCTPGAAAARDDVDRLDLGVRHAASAGACSGASAAGRCRRRSASARSPSRGRRRGGAACRRRRTASCAALIALPSCGAPPPRPLRRSADTRCSGRDCRRAPP